MLLHNNLFPTLHLPKDLWLDAIDPKATGARLRYLRQLHNLSQAELSELMGEVFDYPYTEVSISTAENGHKIPKTETLFIIATVYSCLGTTCYTVDDLIVTYRQSRNGIGNNAA